MPREITINSTGDAAQNLLCLRDEILYGQRPDDQHIAAVLDHCVQLITEKSHANAELHEQTADAIDRLIHLVTILRDTPHATLA